MIKRYTEKDINELADILQNDGVISVPTDTVFGICAKISSKKAYDKLIKIKKRPTEKSFPVMCATENQIKSIAIVNESSSILIKKLMPGPVTIVLKKKNSLEDYVTNGKDTIAVRITPSSALKNLVLELKSPIFMTSANKSGNPTCNSLEEIEKMCPDLDGMMEGQVKYSQGSTIIDCSTKEIKILREGPITKEQVENIINAKLK